MIVNACPGMTTYPDYSGLQSGTTDMAPIDSYGFMNEFEVLPPVLRKTAECTSTTQKQSSVECATTSNAEKNFLIMQAKGSQEK